VPDMIPKLVDDPSPQSMMAVSDAAESLALVSVTEAMGPDTGKPTVAHTTLPEAVS
jgi:hypothetical protein